MKTLQKFASVHAQVHNHFNQERSLIESPKLQDPMGWIAPGALAK